MVFGIKIEGKLTRKSRLVSGGHNTSPPSSVTWESVILAFIIDALNDIYICSCNIGNSYLDDPCRGKLWTKAGSESGSEKI